MVGGTTTVNVATALVVRTKAVAEQDLVIARIGRLRAGHGQGAAVRPGNAAVVHQIVAVQLPLVGARIQGGDLEHGVAALATVKLPAA